MHRDFVRQNTFVKFGTDFELYEKTGGVCEKLWSDGLNMYLSQVPKCTEANFDLLSLKVNGQIGELLWVSCLDVPSVWPVKSTLARIVGWMLAMLPECAYHWKRFKHFF